MNDILTPFLIASVVFLGFMNGCNRTRLDFLEDDKRYLSKRIDELETKVREIRSDMRKLEEDVFKIKMNFINFKVKEVERIMK